jgi:hypothetical protein
LPLQALTDEGEEHLGAALTEQHKADFVQDDQVLTGRSYTVHLHQSPAGQAGLLADQGSGFSELA